MTELTQARLKELLHYDPATGLFYWRERRNGYVKQGAVAGSVKGRRVSIKIDRRLYAAHRLAWLITYGCWPKENIDHINGNPHDNRIANLRECNQSENSQNRRRSVANKSGYTGVSWHGVTQKWRAQIKIEGKTHDLGLYENPAIASMAYRYWKRRLHKFNPILRAA